MQANVILWTLGIILLVALLCGAVLYLWWRRIIHLPESAYRSKASEVSAIAAYYSRGHQVVTPGSGTSDGLRYGIYITTPIKTEGAEAYVEQSSVLYVLDLPFNTQVHLLGVNKSYPLNRLHLETYLQTTGMDPVQLDPAFAAECDMYTGREHEFKVQYALDPDAMAFVKRYCGTHIWELHDSELYIVVPQDAIGDSKFVIEGHSFVEAIRPALPLGTPNPAVVHREIPFDVYDGPVLRCPICQKHMELQSNAWFRCKNGHGMLVTDRELDGLVSDKFYEKIDVTAIVHHGPLTCPNCHHPMEITRYKGNALEVNQCENCQFSWVDTDDHSGLSSLSIGDTTSAVTAED